jgi:hypothetical protein
MRNGLAERLQADQHEKGKGGLEWMGVSEGGREGGRGGSGAGNLAQAETGVRRRHLAAAVRHPLVSQSQPALRGGGASAGAGGAGGGAGGEAGGAGGGEVPRAGEGVTDIGEGADDAADLVDDGAAVRGEGRPGIEYGGAGEAAEACAKGVERVGGGDVEELPVAGEGVAEAGVWAKGGEGANGFGDGVDVALFGGDLRGMPSSRRTEV